MSKSVNYTTEDRQWDARINVQEETYLQVILDNIKFMDTAGKFKYILVSGVEIGTRPHQNDYGVKHIHLCILLHNRMSKSSLLKNIGIIEGNG